MPDDFDPYRERLVMEKVTVWPPEFDDLPAAEKRRIEQVLHDQPESCANLEYVRIHTGFCRKITVTDDDLQRVES